MYEKSSEYAYNLCWLPDKCYSIGGYVTNSKIYLQRLAKMRTQSSVRFDRRSWVGYGTKQTQRDNRFGCENIAVERIIWFQENPEFLRSVKRIYVATFVYSISVRRSSADWYTRTLKRSLLYIPSVVFIIDVCEFRLFRTIFRDA